VKVEVFSNSVMLYFKRDDGYLGLVREVFSKDNSMSSTEFDGHFEKCDGTCKINAAENADQILIRSKTRNIAFELNNKRKLVERRAISFNIPTPVYSKICRGPMS
jgi:hypothetical protein